MNTSNVPFANEMFPIDILTSLLAALPSEINLNLNSLKTLLPLNSETIYGVSGVWYCSK